MRTMKQIALALVVIGAINWGLIGFFNFDLVATIFGGQQSTLSRVIYSLVGLSGLYSLTIFNDLYEGAQDRRTQTNEPSYGTEFGEEVNIQNEDDFNKK